MHLALSATGVDSGISLWRVEVGEDGRWNYESRAVQHAAGTLPPEDLAQLQGLYKAVDWGLETLNNPVSYDDRTLFKLDVDHGGGERRLYQFSEAMNHLSWQFRDLVHFLRHNVADAGDPVGIRPNETEHRPPAMQ
jgi:hypothetical protein